MVNRRAAAGFSLIELMIVIAIVGLLMTLGVPLTRGWVVNTQVRDAQSLLGQGYARAKAVSLRNPGGVSGTMAATILCRADRRLLLIPAGDAATPADCSGPAAWSATLPPSVSIRTAAGDELHCIAFDNRALAIDPSAAGSGSDVCTTSAAFTLGKESTHVEISYH